jgi:hypothetical protein
LPENNGARAFTERVISANADGAFSVYAIDMDGDKDIDVLSASAHGGKIRWFENNRPTRTLDDARKFAAKSTTMLHILLAWCIILV